MLAANTCHLRAWTLAGVALFALLCLSQIQERSAKRYAAEPLVDELDDRRLNSKIKKYSYRRIENYDVDADWEVFKKSGVYIEPFDPKVRQMPLGQLEFQRVGTAKEMIVFHEMLMDAIENRGKFAASTRMVVKWGTKILRDFISMYRQEMALPERIKSDPSFFLMVANYIDEIMELSSTYKQKNGFTKETVPIEQFRQRADALFDLYKRVIDASPVGGYLRWDTARMFQDQPNHPQHNVELKEEVADIVAQARAMGYEGIIFTLRRMVSMVKLFSKGQIPSADSV